MLPDRDPPGGQNPRARRVEATLDILPFPRLREDPAGTACLHCSSALTLHQPDPQSPDRLLGVCEGCHRWFLVDLVPGRPDGVLVGLPGEEVVRALSRPDPEDGISLMGPGDDPGPGDPRGE